MKKLLALLLIPWALIGCEVEAQVTSGKAVIKVFINTHEHDGHKWVVFTTADFKGGINAVHHPDCKH